MELRHLRYFIAVAEELHFAKAAARLQMAQQPLSVAIRRLEEELGVTLFERSTRRVALTNAGGIFLESAYQTIASADQAVRMAQEAERGERGEIRVGYASATLYSITPQLIRAFRERFPNIRVILRELPCTPDMEAPLLRGDVDVALMMLHAQDDALQSITLCRESIYIVLPENHRLAAWPEIPLRELDNEPVILHDRHEKPTVYQQVEQMFYETGMRLNVVQEASSEQAMIGLTAAGLGLSAVTGSLCGLRQTEVVYRRLIEPNIEIDFNLIWRRDQYTPVIRSFVELAQEIFGLMMPA